MRTIYPIIAEKGVDADIAEYHRLKSEKPDDYDFTEARPE